MLESTMTSRERLTAALRREPVDRLPWTVDLEYYNAALRDQGKFDARYEGVEGFLRQHEELGADPHFCYGCAPFCDISYDGIACETRRSSGETTTTWTVDGKTLTAVKRYASASFCWAPHKYPVETVEDMALLLKLLSRCRVLPRLDRHEEMQRKWGERGLLLLGLEQTPVPALITDWCGVMATTFLHADAPDLFSSVLSVLDELYDPLYEAVCEYQPVVAEFGDNISGETVGTFWEKHMVPVYRRRLRQLHSAGITCVIHNDGTVRSVLGKIAAVGFDGAEALTPAPVGDVQVAELRRIAGRDDFILWGMVPGALFSRNCSEGEFRAYVSNMLDTCSGPMIVGSADQVPPDSDLARVRIVADLISAKAKQGT